MRNDFGKGELSITKERSASTYGANNGPERGEFIYRL